MSYQNLIQERLSRDFIIHLIYIGNEHKITETPHQNVLAPMFYIVYTVKAAMLENFYIHVYKPIHLAYNFSLNYSSFQFKIQYIWPFEVIYIFTHCNHHGHMHVWRLWLCNIILKGDHPRTIPASVFVKIKTCKKIQMRRFSNDFLSKGE